MGYGGDRRVGSIPPNSRLVFDRSLQLFGPSYSISSYWKVNTKNISELLIY
ncbi:uncharacterized protein DS421_6g198640 [Arachis hypogaea]|nr:uncharacterized protein DS421_6g198640 [Arachis hypogaea]